MKIQKAFDLFRNPQMTILINVAFFLAWTPMVILCFWTVFAEPETVPKFIKSSPTLFVKTAPLLDPLIYFFFNTKLKSALFAVFKCQNAQELSDTLRRPSKTHELDLIHVTTSNNSLAASSYRSNEVCV